MLKNIHPLLTPELLFGLAKMGHGDCLAIVDANYPAYSSGVPVIRLDAVTAPEAIEAVLSVIPLDTFIPSPLRRMMVVGGDEAVPQVARESIDIAERAEGRQLRVGLVERFDFYEEAKRCQFVVATGETRSYGCFLLTKGILSGSAIAGA